MWYIPCGLHWFIFVESLEWPKNWLPYAMTSPAVLYMVSTVVCMSFFIMSYVCLA